MYVFTIDDIDTDNVSVKNFVVIPTTIDKVRTFIETWHYSKSVNGLR